MNIKSNRNIQKIVVLSVSLLRHSGEILAPVLASISLEYAGVPEVWIQTLLNATMLALVPSLLLAAPLVKATSLKTTTQIAIGLAIFGGLIPLFTSSFAILFASRLVVGVGVGLMNPVSASLITENYTGSEKEQLIGGRTAVASIGTVILSLLGAYLTKFGWRYISFTYLLGIPVMLLIAIFLPNTTANQKVSCEEVKKPKKSFSLRSLNGALLCITVSIFLFTVIINVYPTNISLMMSQEVLGTAAVASVLVAAYKFSSFMSGILFSFILKLFGRWSMTVGMGVSAAGLLMLAMSSNFVIIFIGTVLCGFALGWVLALGILEGSEVSGKMGDTAAISLVTAGMNLGSFFSPLVMTPLFQKLLGTESRNSFILGSLLMFGLTAAVIAIYASKKQKKLQKHSDTKEELLCLKK